MARITLNIDDSLDEETVVISEETAKKICDKLPKSVSYFNIDVNKVLTPVENMLKLKTTEPVHYERGDVVLLDCGKVGEDNG